MINLSLKLVLQLNAQEKNSQIYMCTYYLLFLSLQYDIKMKLENE